MQKIILLFDGCNVEVICQCIREKSIAVDLVAIFDVRTRDVTENHGAARSL